MMGIIIFDIFLHKTNSTFTKILIKIDLTNQNLQHFCIKEFTFHMMGAIGMPTYLFFKKNLIQIVLWTYMET